MTKHRPEAPPYVSVATVGQAHDLLVRFADDPADATATSARTLVDYVADACRQREPVSLDEVQAALTLAEYDQQLLDGAVRALRNHRTPRAVAPTD